MSSVGCRCGWPLDPCNPQFADGQPCDKKRIDAQARQVPGGEAHARQGDPAESHTAAARVGHLTEGQTAVMVVLRMLGQPVLDEELVREYQRRFKALRAPQQTDSGVRSRRSELSNAGLLEQGENRKMSTGGTGRTWQIKPKTSS